MNRLEVIARRDQKKSTNRADAFGRFVDNKEL